MSRRKKTESKKKQFAIDSCKLVGNIQRLESDKLTLQREIWKYKRKPSRKIGYSLLFLGSTAMIASTVLDSSATSLVGLGLVFWGVLFFCVGSIELVRKDLLSSIVISSLKSLNDMIAELGYKGKGIYLSPRRLKDVKDVRVLIPAKQEAYASVRLDKTEDEVFANNHKGIYITPPGLGLANLFEKEMRTDFLKVDLNYLLDNMSELFIEGFNTKDFEMTAKESVIYVEVFGSVFQELCDTAREFQYVCRLIGCPLCSSIACILAKVTGKRVVIEENAVHTELNSIKVCYRILED